MGLTLQTAPAAEPVSLSDIKDVCRVSDTAFDAQLTSFALAARRWAEEYTRRALITQTWDLTLDAWPDDARIVLPRPPVASITSIAYVDTSGATQTLAADQYRLVKLDTGEWAVDKAYGVVWPSLRNQSSAITVRFQSGYGAAGAAVPAEILNAIKLYTRSLLDGNEKDSAAAESLAAPYRVFY